MTEWTCASPQRHRLAQGNELYLFCTEKSLLLSLHVQLCCSLVSGTCYGACWPNLAVWGGVCPPKHERWEQTLLTACPAGDTAPGAAQHTGTRPGDTGTAQLLPCRCLPSLCAKRQRFHPFPWDNIGQSDMILCQEVFPDIQSEFSHFTSLPLSSVYIVKS